MMQCMSMCCVCVLWLGDVGSWGVVRVKDGCDNLQPAVPCAPLWEHWEDVGGDLTTWMH